jgi:hypothetical protein
MDQARSSAQRKALFKAVQERSRGIRPCHLLLDMKARWSSTYVMLIRAESRRQVSSSLFSLSLVTYTYSVLQAVDKFVHDLRLEETNNEKRRELAALALDEEEWTSVRLFCNILQVRAVVIYYSELL